MSRNQFTKMTFGKYLQQLLADKNKTTKWLAQQTGISRAYLDEILNGTKCAPTAGADKKGVDKLMAIAEALQLEKEEEIQQYFVLAEESIRTQKRQKTNRAAWFERNQENAGKYPKHHKHQKAQSKVAL